MQAFSTGSTNFKVAFDNFNNPSLQTYYQVPIDVRVSLFDYTAKQVFTSNFKSLYLSDSTDLTVPTELSGTFTRSNVDRGASAYHYLPTSWPYSSSSSDISQKIVMKIGGGVTCCNSYDNFYLDDNQGSPYTELWTDTTANLTVYQMPTHSSGLSTQIRIYNILNPYPYQK